MVRVLCSEESRAAPYTMTMVSSPAPARGHCKNTWMLRLFDERNAARTMPSATPTKHAHTPMRQAKDFRSKSMGRTLAWCLRDQACCSTNRIQPEMAGRSEQMRQPTTDGSMMTRENATAARKKARDTSNVARAGGSLRYNSP